jgi:hypothetical protein
MKNVYDMSTGQIVETNTTAATACVATSLAPTCELEPRLQPVTSEPCTERQIPPELALADLNAFLNTMS